MTTALVHINRNEPAPEPWPNDVILYQPYEAEQILLAENASCVAVKTFLNMCNLPFQVKTCSNAEFMSPGGRTTKLPFICVGAFVVAELEPIIQLVDLKGVTLTKHLDADEKADCRAFMTLTEYMFTMAEFYISWIEPNVLQNETYKRNGSVYPWPLNYIQNWRKRNHILKQLKIFGWSDYKIDDVIEKVDTWCNQMTIKLGDKKYIYGDLPTELDALVFGHIFTILTTKLTNNILAETLNKHTKLINFCKRINEEYNKLQHI